MGSLIYFSPSTSVRNQGATIREVLPAAAFGTAEDQVMLFRADTIQIGSVPVESWLRRQNSATLGTTLKITQSGMYECVFVLPLNSGVAAVNTATSKDARPDQRTGALVAALEQPEIFGASFKFSTTIQSLDTSCVIPVTRPEARNPNAGIIRLLFGDVVGGTIPAGSYANPGGTVLEIVRIGDIAE